MINMLCGLEVDGLPPLGVRPTDPLCGGYSKISKAPEFTNENHNGLDRIVNYHNKRIFGILGSGDHLIEAVSGGCEKYVGVDISIFSILLSELKFAAVRNLDYNEFRTFFSISGNDLFIGGLNVLFDCSDFADCDESDFFGSDEGLCLNEGLYVKLAEDLTPVARKFYDFLVGGHSGLSFSNYLTQTMNQEEMRSVPYLQFDEAYYAAQRASQSSKTEISFQLADAVDFLSNSNMLFDIIYFSNLFEYKIAFADDQTKAIHELIPLLMSRLNEGGVIADYCSGGNMLMKMLKTEGYESSAPVLPEPTSEKIHLNQVYIVPKQ